VFSGVTDFKASSTLLLSSRWAAKIAADDSNGLRNTSIAQLFSSRATYQFARKWDVSFTGSSVLTHGSGWGEYGLGTEIGYALMKNVWLSSGYNVFGYRDQDLTGDDVTRRGAFLRLRFKFDENIFKPKGEQQ
jgi:large repetitive protein